MNKINNKLLYSFFCCVDYKFLKKKNGEEYIRIKLANADAVLYGYLWDNLSLFKNRIKRRGVYAVKSKADEYNGSKVLNIKNITRVTDSRYDRYGYITDKIETTREKQMDFYFSALINLINKECPALEDIAGFYKSNKKNIIRYGLLESKLNAIRYMIVAESGSFLENNLDESVEAALIWNINRSFITKNLSQLNQNAVVDLYLNNEKEFINKYKYIVDLITLNSSN